MNILVLDDDPSVLAAVKNMLVSHRHKVDVVIGAEAAMELARVNRYDMILVDYRMPGKDGMWFLENYPPSTGTRLIFVTAFGTREIIQRALQLGASGYLLKPFGMQELIEMVDSFGVGSLLRSITPGQGTPVVSANPIQAIG